MDIFSCATVLQRTINDRLNIQIRHSDLPLALCEQRSNILVNVNEILTKTALENLKYMNIYNSLLRKKLSLPPSDPKMHCEPRGKMEMSTYPLCDNQRKRIYSVYNVFKAWRMRKSRQDVTVGIVVISPHTCCLLNTEEGKNNAIYVL